MVKVKLSGSPETIAQLQRLHESGKLQALTGLPITRLDSSPARAHDSIVHAKASRGHVATGGAMTTSRLVDLIARNADISKAAATRALEAMIGGVKSTLKKNNSVSLVGFGTFSVGKRAARSGRNPRTGATIKIRAAKVPKFRPGKSLKDALN